MIEIVTGVPGSGKTAYAMVRLLKTFSKDEEVKKKISNEFLINDVDHAYTNINELKLDKLTSVSNLDFDELHTKLVVLEEAYRVKKLNDKELIEIAKELDLYNAMFIIDEAHNIFDVKNRVYIWWFSYHRHLHQHIILLTQNLTLVEAKYKSFTEIFYTAVPASRKVSNQYMVYRKYTNSRMAKNSEVNKLRFKVFPEIFELYGSGQNQVSKSVILPFFILASVMLIAIFIGYKVIYKNKNIFDEDKIVNNKVNKNINNKLPEKSNNLLFKKDRKGIMNFEDKKLVKLYCNIKECFYNKSIIDIKIIKNLNKLGSEVLFKNDFSNRMVEYVLLVAPKAYFLFSLTDEKGIENENNKMGVNFFANSK